MGRPLCDGNNWLSASAHPSDASPGDRHSDKRWFRRTPQALLTGTADSRAILRGNAFRWNSRQLTPPGRRA
ncbi:hypothetical protein TPCV302_02060 [Cutibacterium avidum]|nr:hypothetical protein TPCV14_19270 [Cutibacterium avidum]BDY00814.1 hypothetical protein TPCV302_02060 [Cutibacterium avidum]